MVATLHKKMEDDGTSPSDVRKHKKDKSKKEKKPKKDKKKRSSAGGDDGSNDDDSDVDGAYNNIVQFSYSPKFFFCACSSTDRGVGGSCGQAASSHV